MTPRKRVDANQAAIVADLRKLGMTVVDLHEVGKGVPDLLVGWKGVCLLVEVKSGPKARLTQEQLDFIATSQAPVLVAWKTEMIVDEFIDLA